MENIRKKFGTNVVRYRHAKGVSQEQLADDCNIARSYMSRVERGLANPSLDGIQKIADGLGVATAELFIDIDPDVSQ